MDEIWSLFLSGESGGLKSIRKRKILKKFEKEALRKGNQVWWWIEWMNNSWKEEKEMEEKEMEESCQALISK